MNAFFDRHARLFAALPLAILAACISTSTATAGPEPPAASYCERDLGVWFYCQREAAPPVPSASR